MVCHHGDRLTDGHYTCWVRAAAALTGPESDTWVHYDDSVVGPPQAALPPTVASDAYLLFYELVPAATDAPEPANQAVETPAAASPEIVEIVDRAEAVADETSDVEMEDVHESDDEMDTT